MPGSPPVSPVHGVPRYADSDAASFSAQVNGITDRFDITAMRLDTGLASARPGTGAGTGAWYYATDTRQLSRWNGSAWETNLPNAHAATHQDGGTDALTVREAMMATGANGLAKGSFLAYRNAALSSVASTAIVFDTDTGAGFDISNWYDTATGRFTPQLAGVYEFSWLVTLNAVPAAGTWLVPQLWKNGVVFAWGSLIAAVSGQTQPPSANGRVLAVANGTTDFFDVRQQISSNVTVALMVGSAPIVTYFCGRLVGRT